MKDKEDQSNFMQLGKTTECGHCNPKEYGAGLRLAEKMPNFICECKCHQSNEWEQTVENHIKQLLAFRKWNDDAKTFRGAESSSNLFNGEFKKLLAFIESEKQKSYEEGCVDASYHWGRGYRAGKAALIKELLEELPQKRKPNYQLGGDYKADEAFNEAISQVRALLERKLTV